jgi:hypothetical protein
MHQASLVDIVESGFGDRVLLGTADDPVTGGRPALLVSAGAATLGGYGAVVYVGENHPLLPVTLLAAAWVKVPFVPIN